MTLRSKHDLTSQHGDLTKKKCQIEIAHKNVNVKLVNHQKQGFKQQGQCAFIQQAMSIYPAKVWIVSENMWIESADLGL